MRARDFDPSQHLTIYDGREMVAFVVTRGQCFHVFGADGEPIGVFDDLRSAVRAIPSLLSRTSINSKFISGIPAAQAVGTADLPPEAGDPPRS